MIEPKLRPPFRYNFAWEEHDFVYCGVAKCASQSMRQMLNLPARDEKPHIRSIEQSWQYTTRLAVIRHPFNRMVSAWRYGWRDKPWETFVGHVLQDPTWDIHTTPQVSWLSVGNNFVPNVVVTLETLDRHWVTLRDEHMPWLTSVPQKKNASPPLDAPPRASRSEIETAYAEDLNLWEYVTNEHHGYMGLAVGNEVGRLSEPMPHRG